MNSNYSYNLEPDQEDLYIRPMFDSLIKQNVAPEIFENLYLESKQTLYFKFLPLSLQTDPVFLKKCLAHDLIYLDQIPEHLKNQNFITYEEYVKLIETQKATFRDNLYPQNKDMILKVLPNLNDWDIKNDLNTNFFEDTDILNAILKRDNGLYLLPKDKANALLTNIDNLKQLISLNRKYYALLPDDEKIKKENLLLILKDKNSLYEYQHYVTLSKDSEVALETLKIDPSFAKKLNQKFWSVIKKHDAKYNAYEFFKSYIEKQNLEKEMDLNLTELNTTKKMKL